VSTSEARSRFLTIAPLNVAARVRRDLRAADSMDPSGRTVNRDNGGSVR
jgi:hypothetical protein